MGIGMKREARAGRAVHKQLRVLTLFAWIMLGASVSGSFAGTNRWTKSSVGMVLDSLVVSPADPNRLYGTNWESVYESTDGGLRWRWISRLTNGSGEAALVIDPSNPKVMYAMIDSEGYHSDYASIEKSTDGGRSWHEVYDFEFYWPGRVEALTLDPGTPSMVYVGTSSGMFKSDDGGATWRSLLDHGNFWDLVVDPAAPQTVYAATDYGALKSTDGGQNWSRANDGLPLDGQVTVAVYDLQIDPGRHSTIYAATEKGMCVTRDGGRSWTQCNTGIGSPDVRRVVVTTASPLRLLAATAAGGIYRSEDGGGLWTSRSIPGVSVVDGSDYYDSQLLTALAADPGLSGAVFACVSTYGVMRTSDSGDKWSFVGRDRSGNQHAASWPSEKVSVGGADQRYLYLVGGDLLRRSSDMGRAWRVISDDLPCYLSDLLVDPVRPRIAYALGYAIYRSADAGRSWEIAARGMHGNGTPRTIAMDPQNPSHLITCLSSGEVFETTDGAEQWSSLGQVTAKQPDQLLIDPKDPSVLYLFDWHSRRIFRSADGGRTWDQSCGFPGGRYNGMKQITLDPHDRSLLYALTSDGLFRRTVIAGTWQKLGPDLPHLFGGWLAFDPDRAGLLYLATDRGIVYKSADGGTTWRDMRPAWPGLARSVSHLLVAPGQPRRLFAATLRGLYVVTVVE